MIIDHVLSMPGIFTTLYCVPYAIQQQSSNNIQEGRSRSPLANCDDYRKLQCNYFDQVEGFLVRPFLRLGQHQEDTQVKLH